MLIGHSMGGLAALRYAELYGRDKLAGVITISSPLLGSPSADILDATNRTAKTLALAGGVACSFGNLASCAVAGGSMLALDKLQPLLPDAPAVQYLKPGSPQIRQLGADLNRLADSGIHIHSIIVGSDPTLTPLGIASGDGVVPAFNQSIANLKSEYAPAANLRISTSRQHKLESYASIGEIHNDSPYSPAVKDDIEDVLRSTPFCTKCGLYCNRPLRYTQTADAPATATTQPGFDLASGAGSVASRHAEYRVIVRGPGITGQTGKPDRFRLVAHCYPGGRACAEVAPQVAVYDAGAQALQLQFANPVAAPAFDPEVQRVKLTLFMHTGYRAKDGRDVVIPSPPLEVALQPRPRLIVPARAAQGETVRIALKGFPAGSRLTLALQGRFTFAAALADAGGTSAASLRLPTGLADGTYRIAATAAALPGALAETSLAVSGKRREPKVEAMKISVPGEPPRWYRPGERIPLRGENWAPFGQFSASLVAVGRPSAPPNYESGEDPGKRRAPRPIELGGVLDLCAGGSPRQQGERHCAPERGEIDQLWQIGSEIGAGRYRLQFSDGLSTASTGVFEIAAAAPQAAPAEPPKKAAPPAPVAPAPAPVVPAPATSQQACDPETPKVWQPGCIEGGAPRVPEAKRAPVSPPPAAPPGPAKFCDPNVPSYAQAGCVPDPGAATSPSPATASPAPRCNPNVPRYSQPGCVP